MNKYTQLDTFLEDIMANWEIPGLGVAEDPKTLDDKHEDMRSSSTFLAVFSCKNQKQASVIKLQNQGLKVSQITQHCA